MRCAIVQPSYIPWRGSFDLIRRVDLFVFYDDVQYDRRGWRNRNRVKTPQGSQWLTIPVHARGAQTEGLPINTIRTVGQEWGREHFETLRRLYRKAPFFDMYEPWLEQAYAEPPELLADFTIQLTLDIASRLGITGTRFRRSSELNASGTKTERLLDVLGKVGATHYLSGPSARVYIDEKQFESAGVGLEWMQYDYPEYPQLHGPYDPYVTVLDLMFMTGERAADYIWRK
ncbi:MAG: WbqC family protein [Thermoanaerobaculia bacterium]